MGFFLPIGLKIEEKNLHRETLEFHLPLRPQPVLPNHGRLQRGRNRLALLLQMIHGDGTLARLRRGRLLFRFPPGSFAAGGSLLHVVDLVSTGPGESFGPGGLLHAGVAAAELGADAGGEQWDFAEEGVQDREAAADDGEVDFDGPVVGQ